jgi:hypothetical protein
METNKHDLALAYVLGELDAATARAVEAQARSDADLRHEIYVLEEGLAARVRALPEHRVPTTAYAALERRLGAATAVPTAAQRVHAFRWALLGGLAALLCVGLGVGGYAWWSGRNQPVVFLAELASGQTRVRPIALVRSGKTGDARFIALASLAEKLWAEPVQSGSSDAAGGGYAVFDPTTNTGFIAVREVPRLPGVQRYHLWFRDRDTGTVHDAGALPLERATRGLFFFSLPEEQETRSRQPSFFLTVEDVTEPASGARPLGRVVLGSAGDRT